MLSPAPPRSNGNAYRVNPEPCRAHTVLLHGSFLYGLTTHLSDWDALALCREAQELLGGAFDYAAAKRELERAKRYSRLMARTHAQAHVSPIPATHAAAAGAAAGVPPGRAGVGAPGAGGAAAKGGAAGRGQRPGGVPVRGAGATAGAAGPGVGAAPAVARGDFAGVLPPPHTVWDVDEAWHDLDEFTRVRLGSLKVASVQRLCSLPFCSAPSPPVGEHAHSLPPASRNIHDTHTILEHSLL